jgi:hypothetical protein
VQKLKKENTISNTRVLKEREMKEAKLKSRMKPDGYIMRSMKG